MARLQFPRQDAILPVSFRSRPGASWRGVRPREASGFSRGEMSPAHFAFDREVEHACPAWSAGASPWRRAHHIPHGTQDGRTAPHGAWVL